MPDKHAGRFTIDVAGTSKTLFSYNVLKPGELKLYLKHARIFKKVRPQDDKLDGLEIVQQRYSIHPSLDMPSKNAIKQTMRLSNGHEIEKHHHTKAIKSKSRFALVFVRQAPDLSPVSYDVRKLKKEVRVSVGQFDTKQFTLFYAVFVGAAGLPFDLPTLNLPPAYRIVQQDVEGYRIVLVISFLSIPSDNLGRFVHPLTFSPDEIVSDELREISLLSEEGGDAIQFIGLVLAHFIALAENMMDDIIRREGDHFWEIFDNHPKDFLPEGTMTLEVATRLRRVGEIGQLPRDRHSAGQLAYQRLGLHVHSI